MKRIAIIGSNGQVASDVVLHLSALEEMQLVPVARSPGGSAFLRSRGISCVHGSITDPTFAKSVLTGCDVIANFALASGNPAAALKTNEDIIRSIFDHSGQAAKLVFFSTLAVAGTYDPYGRWIQNAYGKMKLSNERLFARLVKQRCRVGYTLRLGHVAGPHQNISQAMRQELCSGPIVLPDPDRDSNVTHTITIAEALLAIATGLAGPPGRYDLLDVPQWTWRQVYEKEAEFLAVASPLDFQEISLVRYNRRKGLNEMVFSAIGSLGLRDRSTWFLTYLPQLLNERIKAAHALARARTEIASLTPSALPRNHAVFWPAMEVHPLCGLTRTEELFAARTFDFEPLSD